MAEALMIDAQSGAKALWVRHVAAFAVLIALVAFLFWPNISAALTVYWVSPTFSHCYLIAPISAWLVWNKRDQLRLMWPSVYLPALILILLGAFTKSAQFPFHFWLPHAMAAPPRFRPIFTRPPW